MSAPPSDAVVLDVERVGARGDGIADYQGKPVFLAFTAPGDRVRARLGPKRDQGRIGSVIEVVVSGTRRTPTCPHFGTCGGCAVQHLADDVYVAMKETQVRSALVHRGLDPSVVEPLRRLPPGTRRRARLALHRPRSGAPQVGFHARESREIVDMRECVVLHPGLVAQVAPLRELTATLLGPGDRGAATLTRVDGGIDLLLDLPRVPDLTGLEALAAFAHAHDIARLSWRAGETGTPMPAVERRPARVVLAGVAVDIPADGFLQASAEADQVLAELVLGGVGSARRIADLYAGLGTFTFALAVRAGVHAVDGSRGAVASLASAASRAGLTRITTEARDLAARPLSPDELHSFDAVVFDPPRAGARAQSQALAGSRVPRIVAVSCDPATFARDARLLVDGGYRLMRVTPVDQFLWSPHVELVAWLEKDG